IIQARIPVSRIEEVAWLPFVRFVRLPDYGVPHTGSVTSEGDSILLADQVRSQLGVNGSGVTVGVISDGIAGIFATGCTTCGGAPGGPISTGDLPNATGTRNGVGVLTSTSGALIAQSFRADGNLEGGLGGAPTGAEGTAILEIVHDLAPGAQLRFANFSTSLEFNAAVNFLAQNSDVVLDDIGFFTGPYDGTSSVSANTATALNNNANPIRAYFTSVGNQARMHYQEDFLDSGLDGDAVFGLGQSGNVHQFQATADTDDIFAFGPAPFDFVFLCGTNNPTVCNGVPPGSFNTVIINLVWNDPFGASGNDYNLFLVEDSTGNVVAFSNDGQNGNDFPAEVVVFQNTGTEGFFDILIQNFNNSAATRNFDMFIREPNGPVIFASTGEVHNYNTVRSSVPAQSDAGGSPVSVMSVGAIDAADPGNDDLEFDSSNGPTNDGRLKPDVTGIDGVSVTGAGGFPSTFFGTSAAAPHGAGVAALLLQAAPCLRDGSAGARTDVDARTILRNLIT
ncbi:MAG: S8 family serine peptidase, partial [Gammaproteobacteria bacterium]